MSRSTFLFNQYQRTENELVRKIRQIAKGLLLLNQLIAHGRTMAPQEGQNLKAYLKQVEEQINLLSDRIRNSQGEVDHENLGLHLDQFYHDAQDLFAQLKELKSLPNLESEQEALDAYLESYGLLEEELTKNPSRHEVLVHLHQATDLLGKVNATLESTLNHPLVNIARCATEGAVIETELMPSQGPSHTF